MCGFNCFSILLQDLWVETFNSLVKMRNAQLLRRIEANGRQRKTEKRTFVWVLKLSLLNINGTCSTQSILVA